MSLIVMSIHDIVYYPFDGVTSAFDVTAWRSDDTASSLVPEIVKPSRRRREYPKGAWYRWYYSGHTDFCVHMVLTLFRFSVDTRL